ncbi:unnamed protein product [Zymoseptoria tritici ST99CH_1A5]|uniref:Uncharacterized protein n=1 Tax=Zymoseptoria tritici ST99CH_1A5 TaxID=1276529 RepID=A0A1Y6LRZ3_ZYMTR|nr:unnamed protein product [Zymoseptoria tritici ST99CH_3D1]SMY27152.1 unnamed protein product [Zymoseptoria tritici ST99CH_1A5]
MRLTLFLLVLNAAASRMGPKADTTTLATGRRQALQAASRQQAIDLLNDPNLDFAKILSKISAMESWKAAATPIDTPATKTNNHASTTLHRRPQRREQIPANAKAMPTQD